MEKHMIVGIHITDRIKKAGEVQKVFTKFGCCIKTRVGLHDVSENYCATGGIILLELWGDPQAWKEMVGKLKKIKGVEVKQMVFVH